MQEWLARFSNYRRPPSEQEIREWIARFDEHQGLGEKVLDHVVLASEEEIQRGYRDALEAIPGWHRQRSRRRGQWAIAGFGGAGQSGAEMLRKFREANRLSPDRFDYLFASITDLPSLELSHEDTVIFVDDFSGTGDQITTHWPVHAELIGGARSFLVLTAATEAAVRRIVELQQLEELIVAQVLGGDANVLSPDSPYFSAAEKEALLTYCRIADARKPRGFGDCGLLYVLSHKTPNNSLPILHVNKQSWRGLFPRYLNV